MAPCFIRIMFYVVLLDGLAISGKRRRAGKQ